MVSLCDSIFCGVAPFPPVGGSARGLGVRGRRGVGRNATHALLFFRGGLE